MSVVKAKLNEELGLPAGKQKLALAVRVASAAFILGKNLIAECSYCLCQSSVSWSNVCI